jgi:hypothetical protein
MALFFAGLGPSIRALTVDFTAVLAAYLGEVDGGEVWKATVQAAIPV